jgi:tetratricopeptide (TPR) repeat protein
MQEKKNDEAIRVFLSAIDSNPEFSWPYARLAFLYDKSKEFSKAHQMFKEGIKRIPLDYRLKLDYANFLVTQSEFYDAFAILRELEKINPPGLTVNINLAIGDIFIKRGDYKEALLYIREVLRLEPTNLSVKEKAAFCFQNTNQFSEALKIYLELEKLTPNAVDYLYAIATIARKAGNLKLSESYLERLLKIIKNPTLYFGYAVVLSELNKYQKAVENIKIFLANYPENDHYKQTAQRMLEAWSQKLK